MLAQESAVSDEEIWSSTDSVVVTHVDAQLCFDQAIELVFRNLPGPLDLF